MSLAYECDSTEIENDEEGKYGGNIHKVYIHLILNFHNYQKVHKGKPMQPMTRAEEDLHKLLVDMGLKSGVKLITAKVFAIVFAVPDEIALEDIASRSGYSLSAVSTAVKELERFRKVRRMRHPGSRKVFVKGEKNFVKLFHEQLRASREYMVKPFRESLPFIIKQLKKEARDGKHDKKKREELKEKIVWYECFVRQNETLDELLNSIDELLAKKVIEQGRLV